MNETSLSFYLQNKRIHVFVASLRAIGCPPYVCFLMAEDGKSLALAPYPYKDFHSHRVPSRVYKGDKSLELTSFRLCKILAGMHHWDTRFSYRVPGIIDPVKKVCIFYLEQGEKIIHQ